MLLLPPLLLSSPMDLNVLVSLLLRLLLFLDPSPSSMSSSPLLGLSSTDIVLANARVGTMLSEKFVVGGG